jgi:hypothetical protein
VIDDLLASSLARADEDWWPEAPEALPPAARKDRPVTAVVAVVIVLLSGALLALVNVHSKPRAIAARPLGARPCTVGDARLEIQSSPRQTATQLAYEVVLVGLSPSACRVWDEDGRVMLQHPGEPAARGGSGVCGAHNERRVDRDGVVPPVLVTHHPCLPGDLLMPLRRGAQPSPTPVHADHGRLLSANGAYTDPASHAVVVLKDRADKQGGPEPVFRAMTPLGVFALRHPDGNPLGSYVIKASYGPWTAQPITVVVMSPAGKTR